MERGRGFGLCGAAGRGERAEDGDDDAGGLIHKAAAA
jgi:hypothetical protein